MARPAAFSWARRSWWTNFDSLTALFAEGDSITRGNHSGFVAYPALVNAYYPDLNYLVVNNAVPSDTVDGLIARAASLDAQLPATPRVGVLTVLVGINDFAFGDSVPTFLAQLSGYLDARIAAGWRVIVCTLLPDTADIGANAWRNTANATIITWAGVHANAICDFGGNPVMGPDNAPLDTLLYSDGVHPTIYGQGLLAQQIGAVIASLAI